MLTLNVSDVNETFERDVKELGKQKINVVYILPMSGFESSTSVVRSDRSATVLRMPSGQCFFLIQSALFRSLKSAYSISVYRRAQSSRSYCF